MREDLVVGMRSFGGAVASGAIKPPPGELYPDILVHADRPNGEMRLSYALIKDGKVVAMATLGEAEPYEGLPCFQLNYAVEPTFRGKGLALEIASAAIDEARNGLHRNGVKRWAVEAVIDADHHASLVVAKRLFQEHPPAPIRNDAGDSVYQFVHIVDADEQTKV